MVSNCQWKCLFGNFNGFKNINQFVIFKPLSYCFYGTIGFAAKAWFVRRPVSNLIKPADVTKEF